MIDQRILPGRFEVLAYKDHKSVAQAITDMVVRGAPAIGAAAAFGLAIAGYESTAKTNDALMDDLRSASITLKAARPTAVNLGWALERILGTVANISGERDADDLRQMVLDEAQRIADEDVEINKRMGRTWRGTDQRRRYDHPSLQYRRSCRRGLGHCARSYPHRARTG